MEKKEKTSPLHGTNIFDPATLLGTSPFSPGLSALPFAHLPHLPSTFSMLGHPAFPVTSLFGHLGDGLTGPLGLPLSLATSLSPTTSAKYASLFSSPSPSSSSPSMLFSTAANLSSPSNSYVNTITTSSSSSTPSTSTRGRGKRSPGSGGRGRGSRGGGRGSRGGGRGSRGGGRGQGRRSRNSGIPLSLVQSASLLSPSMLEKYSRQGESNGTLDLEAHLGKSSMSSLFDFGRDTKETTKNHKLPSPRFNSQSPTSSLSPTPSSPSKTPVKNPSRESTPSSSQLDRVHIDSLKKKLIADQIRQRVQSKMDTQQQQQQSVFAPGRSGRGSGRGGRRSRRGRPPKPPGEPELSPQELEVATQIQERIKKQLEVELRTQQAALRLMRKSSTVTTDNGDDTHGARKGKKTPEKDQTTDDDHMALDLGKPRSKSSVTSKTGSKCENNKEDHSPSKTASREEGSTSTTDSSKCQSLDGNLSSMDDTNDSGDCSTDSESENTASSQENSTEAGGSGKRKAEGDHNEGKKPKKRRHVVLDDTKIMIPLDKGWKRQTNIHTYGRRGIVGEVWYFAPCERKMKTIPDVMRYLERHPVDGLSRDNFSFNTKVNVGDFYEARGASGEFEKLTDTEIRERLSVTVGRRMKKIENQKKREKLKMQQILAQQMIENKMKQRMEQQEMARKVAEMQFQKRLEREQQKEILRRAKQMRLMEKRKQKDHIRILREQERIQREEQIRMKKAMRAQQLIEKQRRKQEELRQRRYIATVKKAELQLLEGSEHVAWPSLLSSGPRDHCNPLSHYLYNPEREMKKQQTNMLREQIRIKQEQERRRQHILLLKALEQRKKQEDRERQKEEKIAEKRLFQERKNEQRRMEFLMAQELKKPREDMELRDFRALPELPRIPGNLLVGEAFADCLMVLEFLHNFAKSLGFDSTSLPTLKSLQDAVLCKTEEDGEEFISLVTHLLRYALDDPGVPNPKEAVTKLGQKIVDIEVTDGILSEVLRVFMVARNGGETELSEYLRTYPIEACTANQRAEVLAFLCNELNCGRNIITEIENHLDRMGDIRRDKWVVEGKLRRLRKLSNKKFHSPTSKPLVGDVAGDGDDSMMTTISNISKQNSDDDEDKDDGSCNEDESFAEDESVDDPGSLEDCEKQMEKLQKQHAQYRDKVFDESHHVRAIDLGQDRYKRRFWVLPQCGGVYVEGMESGDIEDLPKVKVKHEKMEVKNIKIEVIGEKTEKKGVTLLEEVEEKKGIDCLEHVSKRRKSGSRCKESQSDSEKVKVKIEAKEDSITDISETKMCANGSEKCEDASKKCEEPMDTKETTASSKSEKSISLEAVKDMTCIKDSALMNGHCEKHIKDASNKVVLDNMVPKNKEPSNKQPGEIDQDKPQCRTNSGNLNLASSRTTSKHVELKIPKVNASAIETDKPVVAGSNLFLQVPHSTKLSDFCSLSIDNAIKGEGSDKPSSHAPHSTPAHSLSITSDHITSIANHHTPLASTSASSTPLSSLPHPPPAHSTKHTSEHKSTFMSIDSILEKKTASSQNNHFSPSVLPMGVLVKTDSHPSDGKPWFSILPRVPCDDMSLTRGQHSSLSSGMLLSPNFMSQLPFHPFPLQSPTFASFQMGQLYSGVGDQSLSARSTPTVDEYFKKPETPVSTQNSDPEKMLKSLHGEPKPIPEEMKTGWWRVGEGSMLHHLQKNLHPRGIREKNLQKTIQRFYDYAVSSCTKAGKDLINLESSSDEESSEEEEEEVEEKESEESQEEESETTGEKKEKKTEEDDKADAEKDTTAEEKEEKEESEEKGEKEENETTDKEEKEKAESGEKEKEKKKKEVKIPVIDVKARSDEADRQALEEIETLEDRVAGASLQIKGWKLAPKTFANESEVNIIPRGEPKKSKKDMYPLENAKERLLQLESNIERRYLKPPLCKVQRISLSNMAVNHNDSFEEGDNERDFESLPIGLQTWRIAVATATSPAQFMLCVMQLNGSIAWEKSIMKVLCQICRKDDNEAELLLCDGCDRGYHTYCFKPKLETVPDGDWYCFECVSKAAGESCCLVCGRRLGRMAECSRCNRCVHIDCLDPPLPRVPRKWFCASCEDGKGAKRRRKSSIASCSTPSTPVVVQPVQPVQQDLTPTGRKRRSDFGIPRKRKTSESQTSEADSPQKKDDSEESLASKEDEKEKVSENEKIRISEQSSDMRICKTILTEMMKHEDGWPFLQPVNCKHFPSYRKYIKTPMDFGSMKVKLRDHGYSNRSEFVSDFHLVVDNCNIFNEDDSEVGQCGHNMKKYFTIRWREVILEDIAENEKNTA